MEAASGRRRPLAPSIKPAVSSTVGRRSMIVGDDEDLVGTTVAPVGHFLDQNHDVRPGCFPEIVDEQRRDAMYHLLLLRSGEGRLEGRADVGEVRA